MFAVAIFGAFAMAPLAKLVGPTGMAQSGLVGRALMAAAMASIVTAATDNNQLVLMQVVVSSVLHSVASHSLATGLTTQTTGAVQRDEQGTLLGLEHSLFSMARIVGPQLGTNLLAKGNFWNVASACGVVDLALVGGLAARASMLPTTTRGGMDKTN